MRRSPRNAGSAPALLALLTLLAASASADQFERYGDLEVHYVALNTTTLSPDMAERYDLQRADNTLLVNIAGRRVQSDGTTEAAALGLEGRVANLLGQDRNLEFEEVREPGAIYYLAVTRFTDRETLRFVIDVTDPETGRTHELAFQKELWRQ